MKLSVVVEPFRCTFLSYGRPLCREFAPLPPRKAVLCFTSWTTGMERRVIWGLAKDNRLRSH